MKYFKKTGALLVLMAALFASGHTLDVQATELAGLPEAGRRCSITIQKYAVDNLNDYRTPGTGEEINDVNLPAIENINFKVVRVQDDAVDAASAVPLEGGDAYSRTIATDNQGIAYFDDLAQGVYLVIEEASSAVHSPVDDFLVTLPMTNVAGNGWMYDVFVYPKNVLIDLPDIDFYVGERGNKYQSIDNGGKAKWIIEADVPRDIVDAVNYQIIAKMYPYLHITDENSITVYAETNDGRVTMLTSGADFVAAVVDNELMADLTSPGRQVLSSLFGDADSVKLYIEFDTQLLIPQEILPEGLNQELHGNATLNYTSSLNNTTEVVNPSSPYVFTGGFHIIKSNNGGDRLDGASFILYRSIEDARQGVNAIENPYTGDIWEVTTDVAGEAYFYGLAYGNMGETAATANQIYYMVETKAPGGYNLLTAPVEATVDISSLENDNYISVVNRTGFILPVTGGVGIVVFLLIGALLVGGAVLLFKIANKKNTDL